MRLLYYTTLLLYYTTLLIHFFTYTPGTIERPWRAAQLGHRIAEECQKVREVYYYTSLLHYFTTDTAQLGHRIAEECKKVREEG